MNVHNRQISAAIRIRMAARHLRAHYTALAALAGMFDDDAAALWRETVQKMAQDIDTLEHEAVVFVPVKRKTHSGGGSLAGAVSSGDKMTQAGYKG